MYELAAFTAIALAGILADRLMGHHLPRDRKNFPKGVEVGKRGLLMVSYLAFTMIFLLLDQSTEMTTYIMLALLWQVGRMFLFEEWYYGFKYI